MNRFKSNMAVVWFALGVLAVSMALSNEVRAQPPSVDPAATRILRQMTDHLAGSQMFSVNTQNTLEDFLESGHRIDMDVCASVVVRRPDKLQAKRMGEILDQVFYYDGKSLTLFNPSAKVYSTKPAPATIEQTLDFARESLGLIVPAADLVYRNAFSLLMQEVTLAVVIGETMINGVKCTHLLFSKPGVDFQVWVAQDGQPLPYKYVVTDTIARLSISTVMSDWNLKPDVDDTRFIFLAPQDAKPIDFMPL
jgi:hypothetical protein